MIFFCFERDRSALLESIRAGKRLKKSAPPPERKIQAEEKKKPGGAGGGVFSLAEHAASMAAKKDRTTLDSLEKRIANRPEKKELEDKNILKSGEGGLQSAREALKKSQVSDNLKHKLETRPTPSELEKRFQKDKSQS